MDITNKTKKIKLYVVDAKLLNSIKPISKDVTCVLYTDLNNGEFIVNDNYNFIKQYMDTEKTVESIIYNKIQRKIGKRYTFTPYSSEIYGNKNKIINEEDFKCVDIELMKYSYKNDISNTNLYMDDGDKICFDNGNAVDIIEYKNGDNILNTLKKLDNKLDFSQIEIEEANDITNLEEAIFYSMQYADYRCEGSYSIVNEECKKAIRKFTENLEKSCGKYMKTFDIFEGEAENKINKFYIDFRTECLVFENYLLIFTRGSDE